MPHLASRALRSLGLAALLAVAAGSTPALIPSALAAPAPVPVLLPAGQNATDWADALAARGLAVSKGAPAAGPSIVLLDKRDYWEMTVRGWGGEIQTVNVAPPTSAAEREDLLFYASTLLGKAPASAPAPVPVPVAVPAPVPVAVPTPVPAEKPAPVAASKPADKPAPVAAEKPAPVAADKPAEKPAEKPVASASTAGASTASVAAPTGGTGLWIGAGGGVGIRAGTSVVGDFRVDGGWHLTPSIRAGVGVAGRTAATLSDVGEGGEMRDLDVVAQAAWVAPMSIAPVVGLYGGVSARTFVADGATLVDAVLPVLGAEAGVQIPLGALPVHLEPSLRVQGDLREVQLVSAAGTTTLAPLEIRAALTVGYRAR